MWALLIRWLSYLSWLFMSVDGSIAYLSVHVESLGKLFCPHEVVTLSLEPLGLLLVHGRGRALLLHLGTQKHYITYFKELLFKYYIYKGRSLLRGLQG